MAGYYFVRSNGHFFRLTKKAYHTWIIDSANRLANKKAPAKLKNYGTDVGPVDAVASAADLGFKDFFRLRDLYSNLDTESNN